MHGRIIFPDGTRSQTFYTKHQAKELGKLLVGLSISEPEWIMIKEGIDASQLVDHNTDIEKMGDEMTECDQKLHGGERALKLPCNVKLRLSDEWSKVPGIPHHAAYGRMKKFLTQFSAIDESKRFVAGQKPSDGITLEIPAMLNSHNIPPLLMLARSGDIKEEDVVKHLGNSPWYLILENPDDPEWKGTMSVVDCEIALGFQALEPKEF